MAFPLYKRNRDEGLEMENVMPSQASLKITTYTVYPPYFTRSVFRVAGPGKMFLQNRTHTDTDVVDIYYDI